MDNDYKNARRRYRRRLAKQLVLQAERVCESLDKEPKVAQEVLDRMMKAIFDLRHDERNVLSRSNDLVKHLRDCAKGAPYVEQDEETPSLLVLEGIFDLSKLSKRVFWYDHREVIKDEIQEIHQCL